MAGRQRDIGPVKISVVGGGQKGSKIWRRERIEMTNDPDLDDCAFLSGNEGLPNELAMQILFQLFNRIYPATSLPLFCSVVHLQQLITFTVFPFTF